MAGFTLALVAAVSVLPGTSSAGAAPPVKPALVGLLERQGVIDDQWAGILRGIVVQVDWAVLQPAPDGPVVDANPIDVALASVRAYNVRHPEAQSRHQAPSDGRARRAAVAQGPRR